MVVTSDHLFNLKRGVYKMKSIKKILRQKMNKYTNVFVAFQTSITFLILSTDSVFAEGSNTESIDSFITFICDWLTKIGGVIALIGGVMFAAGWLRDEADGKYRGLMVVMAGFMVIAVSQSPSIFGL